ncbi:MAG TPA: T9SS type A sorting domain-containing protein, partial [Leptospiraceae bacterium]|nr:T9SS type A sorting domain-containing protein [Leptospiraceae bacterium]
EGVKLYPNPSTGTITIEKASGGTLGLYDIQGKLLLSRGIKSEKETLSLGNLPEGLYIWRVEDLIHGGYETGKLVIQR